MKKTEYLVFVVLVVATCLPAFASFDPTSSLHTSVAGKTEWMGMIMAAGSNSALANLSPSEQQWSDVTHYGARGNGSTDNTAAIQSLVNSLSGGGIIYFPPGDYVINGQITINQKDGIIFKGMGGKSRIVTTLTVKDDSRDAFFHFYKSHHSGLYDLTIDESAVTRPPTSRAWVADIWAIGCDYFVVKDCHFVETVSSGISITSGKACLIDGVTAQGVRGYGYSAIDRIALDGNFISINGDLNTPVGGRGGNIVTNCRLDGFSRLTSFHWNDFGAGGAGGAGMWHDNNCGILTEPLGDSIPDAPSNIVCNNYIAHFGWGGYTEHPGSRLGGRQIFANNIVFECYMGYEIQNTAKNTKVVENYFESLAGDGIYSHCLDNVDISNNLFHDLGIHKRASGYEPIVYAVYGISELDGQKNFRVSGNMVLIENRNIMGGALRSKPLAIKVRASAGQSVENVLIQGNIFELGGRYDDTATFTGAIVIEGNVTDAIISDNIVSGACSAPLLLTSPPNGSMMDSPARVTISGNHFSNNNLGAGYSAGIILRQGTRNVNITGNSIHGNRNSSNFLDARDSVDSVYCNNNLMDTVPNAYSWSSTGRQFSWNTYSTGGSTTSANRQWTASTTGYSGKATASAIAVFRNGDTSPSVAAGNEFKTGNTSPVLITAFDDGAVGQTIYITFDDSNTSIQNNEHIKLRGGTDFSGEKYDQLALFYDGSVWMERYRSVNHRW